jgi:two-component sensor histidine kinase/Tfp pilus assembly protein PilF
MKHLIWLCIFHLNCLNLFGQSSTDSLRVLLLKARSEEKAIDIQRHSSRLAWLYLNKNENDSAIKYYNESLNAIPHGTEIALQGNILHGLGAIFDARGKFDSCIHYYKAALDKLQLANDTSNALTVELRLSIAFKNVGLYEESLAGALHVISSINPSDNSLLRGSCYNTIGSVYTRTRDFHKALEYYRLALENRKLNNQVADVARIHNNIGELFILTRQYDSATHNLQRAADIKHELKDIKGLARTLNNLGKVSMLTGNLDGAALQFKQSQEIQKDIDDPVGMIELLNNVGELNILTKQLRAAESNLRQSEVIILRAGTPEYLRQNLELRVRLDRERRDFASGMMHLGQLSEIKDSLLNEEKNRSMQAMEIRYETLKKEQQIAMLEQGEEINQTRIRNNQFMIGILILGLVLVAAVGALVYVNFRNARAAAQRIGLLLADMRHRNKNNLQTLASIFHLQARHFTDLNMAFEARSSESRVHAMSLLHEKFYSVSEGNSIDLRKYVTDLVNQVVDIYGFRTRALSLTIDIDDIQLDIDKALPLSLIIQELVSNVFKYAFIHEPDPSLTVEIKVSPKGDQIATTISDNGVGLNSPETSSSQGLSLVEDFTTQLDGKFQVKSEKGVTFIISFPITPSWKKHLYLS